MHWCTVPMAVSVISSAMHFSGGLRSQSRGQLASFTVILVHPQLFNLSVSQLQLPESKLLSSDLSKEYCSDSRSFVVLLLSVHPVVTVTAGRSERCRSLAPSTWQHRGIPTWRVYDLDLESIAKAIPDKVTSWWHLGDNMSLRYVKHVRHVDF